MADSVVAHTVCPRHDVRCRHGRVHGTVRPLFSLYLFSVYFFIVIWAVLFVADYLCDALCVSVCVCLSVCSEVIKGRCS